MTTAKRVLGVVRLSVLTDETTSPARQRKIITEAAARRGATVTLWAEDLDVSASKTHPLERPELAAALAQTGAYDEIIFWRLDRFARKVSDFSDMIKWCQQHGKGLVSATETFDLSDPMGMAMAQIISVFAELEASIISARVTSSRKELRENGRFAGGKPPYGFAKVRRDGGWILVPDPQAAEVVREAARRVIGGDTLNSICADFSRRGIPAPKGGASWRGESLAHVLKSPATRGETELAGKAVRGADGMPLRRAESLLTAAEAGALDEAMAGRPEVARAPAEVSLLRDIAVCAEPGCGAPLWKWQTTSKQRGGYRYYRCSKTFRRAGSGKPPHKVGLVRQAFLEEIATEMFLSTAGRSVVMRRQYDPGEDHAAELAQVRKALSGLQHERDAGQCDYPGGEDDYNGRLTALTGRLKVLAAKPSRAAGWQTVPDPSGATYGQLWEELDTPGRRALMVSAGFAVSARPGAVTQLKTGLEITGSLADQGVEQT